LWLGSRIGAFNRRRFRLCRWATGYDERERSFDSQDNLALTRGGGGCRSSASPDGRTDSGTLSAARDASKDCTQSSAAADQCDVATGVGFAVNLLGLGLNS
jgi:hypothetical protein